MNPLVSPAGLMAEEGDVIVVDVRHSLSDPLFGIRAYAEGHLPEAAFLSVDEELSGPAGPRNGGRHPLPLADALRRRLGELGGTDETLFIAYDDVGGLYAARFWWLLRWIGHDRVAVLDGGLQAWRSAGGVLSTNDHKPARKGHLSIRPTLCPTWDIDMVQAWAAAGSAPEIAILLDARAESRYRGEEEPFDPVAGHIPGAQNRPLSRNLTPEGYFKDRSVLRDEYEALLQGDDASSVVHTCGSGISACHNLLAMEYAGLPGSALYNGSWSEWCSLPLRQD